MRLEKLTTSLQFVGAALAVPAGVAGVYSAYHNYFSPEVQCHELRNATLVTLEKNIPVEAKRALLRNDVGQFEAKCKEIEPETAMVFQVALQDLDKPAPPPRAAQKPARPAAALAAATPAPSQAGAVAPASPAPVSPAPAANLAAPNLAAPSPAPPSPAPSTPAPSTPAPSTPAAPNTAAPARSTAAALAPPSAMRPPIAPPLAAPPAVEPAAPVRANPAPAVASLSPTSRFTRPVHGWVAIEARKAGKVTDAFFSGYPADGVSVPPPGTILTAMAFRPIWSEPQGQGPIDPTRLQGRIKVGECVRVIGTTASLGRQWAEVEPAACP